MNTLTTTFRKSKAVGIAAILCVTISASGCAVLETVADIAFGAAELILSGEQSGYQPSYSYSSQASAQSPSYQAYRRPAGTETAQASSRSSYLGSLYRHCIRFEPKRFNGDFDKYINSCNVDLEARICDHDPRAILWRCDTNPDGIGVSVAANGRTSAANLYNREILMACKKGDQVRGIYCESR